MSNKLRSIINCFTDYTSFHSRCIECVKASPYLELANELEITKAITYLKEKDLAKVCKVISRKPLQLPYLEFYLQGFSENPGDCQNRNLAMEMPQV